MPSRAFSSKVNTSQIRLTARCSHSLASGRGSTVIGSLRLYFTRLSGTEQTRNKSLRNK